MKHIPAIALALTIIGGINWGLVGLLNLDLVATLFGPGTTLSRIIYVLVGIAAIYSITLFKLVCNCPARTDTTTTTTSYTTPIV